MMLADPATTLTQNQLELVALFASGDSYQQIADAKFLSYNTVRYTLDRARVAVGAETLTHLCVLCIHAEILKLDPEQPKRFLPVVDPYVAE